MGRQDFHHLVNYFLDNKLVDPTFVDYVYNYELQFTNDEMKSALLSSTSVSLYDAFKMQMDLNNAETKTDYNIVLPICSHVSLDTNCHGTTPFKTFTTDKSLLYCLEAIARFSSDFLGTLFSTSHEESCDLAHLLADVLRSTSDDRIFRTKRRLNDGMVSQNFIVDNYYLEALKDLRNHLQIPVYNVNNHSCFDTPS